MQNTPSYYRARLKAFEQLIREETGGDRDQTNNNLVILRNGVIPNGFERRIDKLLKENLQKVSNSQLSFAEITRFNNWFEMCPEKVAGTEVITSSREFPIMIKGTEEDIIRIVTPTNLPNAIDKKDKRIRMAKAKAIARKRRLEIMKF